MSVGPEFEVLPAGLDQLGAKSRMLAGGLSAAAAVPPVATSSWQSSAGDVNAADAETHKDVVALAGRVESRGRNYSTAGVNYAATDATGERQMSDLVV